MIIIRVLGSLDAVVRGFIGVYLLVSREMIRTILTSILTRIIPGFASAPLVERVERTIDAVLFGLTGWLDSMAGGAASFIATTPAAINTLFDAVEEAIWAHTSWIKFLSQDVIPWLQRRLEALIDSTRAWLMYVIAVEIARTQAWVRSLADALTRRLSAEIHAVRLWTTGWINILHRDLQVVQQTVLRYVDRSVTLVRIDMVTIQRNLTALINSTARALTVYTDRTAQAARDMAVRISLEGARAYTNEQLSALRDALVGAFTDIAVPSWEVIRDAESEILEDFPDGTAEHTREIDALPEDAPTGLVETFGALSATSALSMSWILDAGIPLWRRMHTFGDTIDEMQDDSLIEGILTLLAFAVLDPEGSAKEASVDMSETLTGVVSGTMSSLFPDNRGE